MAIVEQFLASLQLGDSSKGSLASGTMRVSATDARAYIAAADQTARDATKVGLLLDSFIDVTRAAGTQGYKKWSVESNFINDAFARPDKDDAIYNSNKWKVTYQTTNGGLPVIESMYIPQYLITGVVMDADGISADLEDEPMANLEVQILDTGLSSYGTAITSLLSVQRNDT